MSTDVSKRPWPFISPIAMNSNTINLDTLRKEALELLAREGGPVHTGQLAARLGVPTHQVHLALDAAYQTGKVNFTSSGGWAIVPPFTPPDPSEGQGQLA